MAGSTTPDYTINYEDQRFANVKANEQAALDYSNAQYDQMLAETDSTYQGLVDATSEYGKTQAKNQQELTDFTVEKIEQQKAQAQKDLDKETGAAYADYTKATNRYGVNAEQMAASGLSNSGFSESSRTQMYVAYQNRVATARETYSKAVLNYDNSIKEAQLANSSALAEIAFNTLQTTLTLGIEKFQYKNNLMSQKMSAQREIDNTYYNRWENVLAQMNQENALAEQIRQFNESMLFEKAQHADDVAYRNAALAQDEKQFNASQAQNQAQFDATMLYNKDRDKIADDQWLKEFNESKRQYNKSLAEDKRRFNVSSKKGNNSSGGTSGGTVKISKGNDDPKLKEETVSKTSYKTLQTNLANMMLKGTVNEATRNNMASQIEQAYNRGDITLEQAKKLINQLD